MPPRRRTDLAEDVQAVVDLWEYLADHRKDVPKEYEADACRLQELAKDELGEDDAEIHFV